MSAHTLAQDDTQLTIRPIRYTTHVPLVIHQLPKHQNIGRRRRVRPAARRHRARYSERRAYATRSHVGLYCRVASTIAGGGRGGVSGNEATIINISGKVLSEKRRTYSVSEWGL